MSAPERELKLLRDAATLMVKSQFGSVHMLARLLQVGFADASRVVDLLEALEVVAPAEAGGGVRQVLAPASGLPALLNRLQVGAAGRCQTCRTRAGVLMVDPYDADVNNKIVLTVLCDPCETAAIADV